MLTFTGVRTVEQATAIDMGRRIILYAAQKAGGKDG